jgi:hypothetical protein
MHLVLMCRAPGETAWSELSSAPVIELPGYGIDAAWRKLVATRERYGRLDVIHPDAEFRIVSAGYRDGDGRPEPEIASGAVTAAALAIVGAAAAIWLGIATHAI